MTQRKSPFMDIDLLYRNYIDDLYSYAISMGFDRQTSMDAIHDVFYKLCTNEKYLEKVNDMKFFMLRSLRNRLIDIHRAKKEYAGLSSEEIPFTIHISVEEQIIQNEEDERNRIKVEQILDNLTDRQREIIYLRYMLELDYERIAEMMQISVSSSRKLVYKSLIKLRKANCTLFFIINSLNCINLSN